MSRKISSGMSIVTDKGVIYPKVREDVKNFVKANLLNGNLANDLEPTKSGYEVRFDDQYGQSCYARIDITVSTKSGNDLAPKKKAAKKSEPINIEIE